MKNLVENFKLNKCLKMYVIFVFLFFLFLGFMRRKLIQFGKTDKFFEIISKFLDTILFF